MSDAETSSPKAIFLVSATSRPETPFRKSTTALGAVSSSPPSLFFVTSPRAKVRNGSVGCSSCKIGDSEFKSVKREEQITHTGGVQCSRVGSFSGSFSPVSASMFCRRSDFRTGSFDCSAFSFLTARPL